MDSWLDFAIGCVTGAVVVTALSVYLAVRRGRRLAQVQWRPLPLDEWRR